MNYRWDGQGPNPDSVNTFLFSTKSKSDLGAYIASCPIDIMGDSSKAKRLGYEADHSLPSTDEVKNVGSIPPLPHISSWHSA
jgi:hypothetical protein